MSAIVLIVPGSLETRTGGYEYDRRMASALSARGWTVDIRDLNGDFPNPSADTLKLGAGVLASIPDGTTVVIDGLAFGAMPSEVEHEAARLRLVALVHMPLALEVGLDPGKPREREERERRALAAASLVVVTGKSTAATLAGYGVSSDRIAIVEPGTDAAPLAAGSGDQSAVHLVCVATLNPGKGHDILFRALAKITDLRWRLTCAGSDVRYPATVRLLRAILRANNLLDRVTLVGELDGDAIAALYDRADLFVLATLHESYGMAVAEALARGLPVVSTATGAIPDLVGDEAGIVVPPGDEDALAHALASAMDSRLRAQLAHGARRVRERLPTWRDAAAIMAASLERIDL